jgi:integrase
MEEAWIELHLGTGARPGEVVNVRRSDVDLEQSTVRLIDRKHGGRPRTVAIDSTTASVLADWFEIQDTRIDRTANDPYVLSMDVEGARPWRAEYASKYRWHALAQRARLRLRTDDPSKSELPLYSLRHTHNSLLAAAGVSAATRGRRIGNTEQTNASTYTHLVSREDREAAAIIERRLGVRTR